MHWWISSALLALTLLSSNRLESPAQPTSDACRSQIPGGLGQILQRHFPERRLPSVSDSSSEDVQSDRAGGGNGCLLVQRDDFDGDGREDTAVGLPPRAGRAPVVAVALKRDRGWAISTIERGSMTSAVCMWAARRLEYTEERRRSTRRSVRTSGSHYDATTWQ
jgi:hypothetical protein